MGDKARDNELKHRVKFTEALEVFQDDHSLSLPDPDHSLQEQRYLMFGLSKQGQHLVVSYTERADRVRLISARLMTPHERRGYEQ